ncbi:MAG: sulfotransferase family protein [Colwellia sp.]|nr:sulfotransferase family protein [Colwellia sp.]
MDIFGTEGCFVIISYEKKFLFCHIPKTAGTSISNTLQPFTSAMEKHWFSRITRKIIGVSNVPHKMVNFQNYPHWSMLKASEIIPQAVFGGLYKFAFVRHPVQWQYSIFRHILRHSEIDSFKKRYANVYKNKNFDDYIRWRIDNGVIPQVLQLINKTGNILLDDIFYYEQLNSEFERLLEKLNISVKLPHVNINNIVAPIKMDKSTEQLILDNYKNDFDILGYDEVGKKEGFVFNTKCKIPEIVELLKKVGSSNYDTWKANIKEDYQ